MNRIITRTVTMKSNYESIKFHKKIQPNSVYRPRDLNESFQEKPKPAAPKQDVLEQLQINPIKEYTNPVLLSHFLTRMGHIKNAQENGLEAKNQKRVARAIKRARAFGLLPFTYKPF